MADAKFVLGGQEYTAPAADLGQLEELLGLTDRPIDKPSAAFSRHLDMAEILFRNAEPKIENVRRLRCSGPELKAAVSLMMAASGLTQVEPAGEDKAAAAAA